MQLCVLVVKWSLRAAAAILKGAAAAAAATEQALQLLFSPPLALLCERAAALRAPQRSARSESSSRHNPHCEHAAQHSHSHSHATRHNTHEVERSDHGRFSALHIHRCCCSCYCLSSINSHVSRPLISYTFPHRNPLSSISTYVAQLPLSEPELSSFSTSSQHNHVRSSLRLTVRRPGRAPPTPQHLLPTSLRHSSLHSLPHLRLRQSQSTSATHRRHQHQLLHSLERYHQLALLRTALLVRTVPLWHTRSHSSDHTYRLVLG